MKLTSISFVLFLLSVVILGGITIFESTLVGMSTVMERLFTFLLLVLPAAVGAVLAGLSLARKEGIAWMAGTLLALNALFALFHLALVLFAG
jgi:hypothetical protein